MMTAAHGLMSLSPAETETIPATAPLARAIKLVSCVLK